MIVEVCRDGQWGGLPTNLFLPTPLGVNKQVNNECGVGTDKRKVHVAGMDDAFIPPYPPEPAHKF